MENKTRLWAVQCWSLIPSPCRCFKCQKFGHNSRTCRVREDMWPTRYISGYNKEACLNPDKQLKWVWDRVRIISGKNVCPPKRYLNVTNGVSITDPKGIATEHAAHYSARVQNIKIQDEVQTDFTSYNTDVYNKPFRLRDLRHSILETKPHAPGPDGIHNNLLKNLPDCTYMQKSAMV